MKRASVLLRLIALLLCPSPVLAQAYPGKPVRIVVPYSAGGGTDIVARAVGQRLADAWGQPGLVDNRAGASGMTCAKGGAGTPAGGTIVVRATRPETAVYHRLSRQSAYNPE